MAKKMNRRYKLISCQLRQDTSEEVRSDTHHMSHMIPRCARIHNSHLSCKHTEELGKY